MRDWYAIYTSLFFLAGSLSLLVGTLMTLVRQLKGN